jgi:Tol biopolymer transport system component
MKKLLAAILALTLAALACATPFTNTAPQTNIETVVAQTMQALTSVASPAPVTTSAPPSGTSDLLPHPLYYLNNDSAGFLQVYRLATDGKTVQQITFEPSNVETYDISPVDGSVAYTSNNQMLLVKANGADRLLLVDGGPLDSDESYISSRVSTVAWSPDGKTIAFGYGGLNFYALDTGAINKALENQVDTSPGIPILREGYSPNEYAPDGSKLLINISYYEGGVYALYYLSGNTLIRSDENAVTCCNGTWTPDSSAYYAASPYLGMTSPGLWRINADGKVDTLLDGEFPGPVEFAQAPILGPDGQLYFFHYSLPQAEDIANRVPLYMVRSGTDGVTGQTNLYPEPFENINEILWAPDASFAVLAIAPVENVFQGGKAEIYYADGSPSVPLVPFAQDMRWGP